MQRKSTYRFLGALPTGSCIENMNVEFLNNIDYEIIPLHVFF